MTRRIERTCRRDDTRLGPWLFTSARNLYASHCRTRLAPFDVLDEAGLWPAPVAGREALHRVRRPPDAGVVRHRDTATASTAAGREIVSARLFIAPPARLFEACTHPARLAQWWGPRGFTNTILELDPRPGGRWRAVMHGPDGTDYPVTRQFVEVSPPRRLVVRHEQGDHSFTTTITFEEREGGTLLTWRMQFDLASEVERLGTQIRAANEQNFDRLAEHLEAGDPEA